MNTIDRIYNAVAFAETGGESNPWIRTRLRPAGGSTAYGPAQLTIGKAEDYFTRHHKALAQFQAFFIRFQAQACKFLRWGGVDNLPDGLKKYDYGGAGDISGNTSDMRDYVRFCKAIMQIDLQGVDYNLGRFIEKWRGVPECEDPGYYKKIREKMEG